jgi:hypothetical protein
MEQEQLNDPTLKGTTDKEKKEEIAKRNRQGKLAVEDRISHLERFENEDKNNPFNVVFSALEDFTGPVKERTITDKKWMYPVAVLFLIFVAHGFSST